MNRKYFSSVLFIFGYLLLAFHAHAGIGRQYLEKGWQELIHDNEMEALKNFNLAYDAALISKDTLLEAEALLHIGICTYSISSTQGIDYALKAMKIYSLIEEKNAHLGFQGRSKCLQLMSTIKARQGKFRESIVLSKEALNGFDKEHDTTGYAGLVYNSLGSAYKKINMPDSSAYFHRKALAERLLTQNFVYLPGSYVSIAEIEMNAGDKELSHEYFKRALHIADSTQNKQAQVLSLIGLANWEIYFNKNYNDAQSLCQSAYDISNKLADKSYFIKTLDGLIKINEATGGVHKALEYERAKASVRDSQNSYESLKLAKSMEVQFSIAEKDRQLKMAVVEKNNTQLTNYLLWVSVISLVLIGFGAVWLLKKINKRDKALLQTKEALLIATENQKKLKEQQLRNDLEYKESQLSALTLQMLQKNELMQELKEKLDGTSSQNNNDLAKILSKGMNHDKEWQNFNTHFESINKNFYDKLKQNYPDISPNDLKICALIKLNLSIKEMAAILNISPDSVKTARYRLRKKLQLNSEDNLTDFIFNLK